MNTNSLLGQQKRILRKMHYTYENWEKFRRKKYKNKYDNKWAQRNDYWIDKSFEIHDLIYPKRS